MVIKIQKKAKPRPVSRFFVLKKNHHVSSTLKCSHAKLFFQGNRLTTYLSLEINPAGLREIDYQLCASRIFVAINNITSNVSSIATLTGSSGCPSGTLQKDTNNYDSTNFLCHTASEARPNSERYLCCKYSKTKQ